MGVPLKDHKIKKIFMVTFRAIANRKKIPFALARTAVDDVYQPICFAYDAMEEVFRIFIRCQ